MDTTPQQPEQEPTWPSWERRTPEWSPVRGPAGVCACAFLERRLEDVTLLGVTGWIYAECPDCGRGWEMLAQGEDRLS